MRNTSKFSLLGTLLCTMSIISSNGYSVEDNNPFFLDKSGNLTLVQKSSESESKNKNAEESDEEFVNRILDIVEQNLEHTNNCIFPIEPDDVKRFKEITETSDFECYYKQHRKDKYDEIMKKSDSKDEKNISAESDKNADPFFSDESGNPPLVQKSSESESKNKNAEETDEEFIKRIEDILHADEAHFPEYLGNGDVKVCIGKQYDGYIIPKAEMNRYNRIKLNKTINTFNINTDPSEIANFAKQLRTKESRKKYSRQADPASVDFAMKEYPSLNLILNKKITSNTIENLATKLLQDHLSFISEFSSGNVANKDVRMLFYNAWVKIFILAAYNSNNPNLPSVLKKLGDTCFEHFNIAYFYRG